MFGKRVREFSTSVFTMQHLSFSIFRASNRLHSHTCANWIAFFDRKVITILPEKTCRLVGCWILTNFILGSLLTWKFCRRKLLHTGSLCDADCHHSLCRGSGDFLLPNVRRTLQYVAAIQRAFPTQTLLVRF